MFLTSTAGIDGFNFGRKKIYTYSCAVIPFTNTYSSVLFLGRKYHCNPKCPFLIFCQIAVYSFEICKSYLTST